MNGALCLYEHPKGDEATKATGIMQRRTPIHIMHRRVDAGGEQKLEYPDCFLLCADRRGHGWKEKGAFLLVATQIIDWAVLEELLDFLDAGVLVLEVVVQCFPIFPRFGDKV